MIKKLILTMLLGSTLYWAEAQTSTRSFRNYKYLEDHLEIETTDGNLILKPYNDKIIEVVFIPQKSDNLPPSYAINMKPEKVETRFMDQGEDLEYGTSGIKITIHKNPFKLSYSYQGTPLTSESAGYFDADSLMGFKLKLDDEEVLYGGGERVLGMNRRGNRLTLYNKPSYGFETKAPLMYYSMPLVISSKKYMVLWDNTALGYLDLGSTHSDELSMEAIGGRSAYVIIAGDDYYDLTEQYTQLTGRQPLLPRWALGNFASRFGYHTQKEVLKTIDAFEEDHIPVDAIVLDIYWFGKDVKGHMGNLEWDKKAFPEPDKMMQTLQEEGVHTVLITEPFILTTSKKWDDAVRHDILGTDSTGQPFTYEFFFGETGLIDIFKPEARNWFWDIYKKHTAEGVDGWWGDLGEPEMHPSELRHVNGMADEVHNAYGHEWAHLIYEGLRTDFPNKRPFTLMRSGFAGSQRYGMVPWSGDVNRTWGGLQSQPEIALQMAMQGLAYAHSDLGGFAGDYKDAELYTRWLQYGIYQPIYRPHAQEEVPSEPVFWDKKTKALAKQSINMRYRLLPYIYTIAFENSQKGYPLMRPLFFDEPDNPKLLTYSEAYMWGPDMLVAPVLQKGQKEKEVYLPKNHVWFDFYGDASYVGGKEITVSLEEDHIPVFVRSGSFIPMLPNAIANTTAYNTDTLLVHYFAHNSVKSTDGYLYDDDGKTADSFSQGKYEIINFKSSRQGDSYNFFVSSEGKGFEGAPDHRIIDLIIHGLDENNTPRKIEINGEKIKVRSADKSSDAIPNAYITEKGLLHISFDWNGDDLEIIW